MDVVLFLKLGFGRQGLEFEPGSWFMKDMVLGSHLGFWGMRL